jgi:hemolysin activation/secretion protein
VVDLGGSRRSRRLRAGLVLGLGFAPFWLSAAALAQADPAATLARQNEEQVRALANGPRPATAAVVTDETGRAELPPAGGPTVLLKSVVFDPPSAFFTKDEIDAIISRYVGRQLDFRGIATLVRDVNDLYAEKGIVTAGAVLPPQDLSTGNLTVRLVEGRQGVVSIVGEHRTDNDFLLRHVTLTRGDGVVDVPQAARDITWFNKTHQAQMSLALRPGATFGLTDLTLGVTEPPANSLQFFLDNEGVASTGDWQWGGSYQAYGLAGIDDRLMAYATASLGSLAGTATYDLPISRSGTRLSLSQTLSGIKVIDGPSKPLYVTGNSSATTVTLSQPVIADTDWTLLALGSLSYGESHSYASDVPLVDASTSKVALGFSLSYSKDGNSFAVQPQLIYVHAEDHLLDGYPNLLIGTAFANGALQLPGEVTLVGRAALQYTRSHLLPGSLLFQIGGPNTVRGYPSDGVAGDSGYYLQAELHHEVLAEGVDGFVFVDYGQVFSTFPAKTTMGSVGFGVSWAWNDLLSQDVTVAIPVIDAVPDQGDLAVYTRLVGKAL